MIFAAIGNIDGHNRALEAAIDAIVEAGIQTILHTGNAAAGAAGGNEVLALLDARGVICVQGNTDRLVVRFSRKQETMEQKVDGALLPALRFAHEHLTSQNLERLRDWRKSQTVALEEWKGFLCHGSPGNPREILTADTPLSKMQRQREIARCDIIVCGGSPEPFSRFVDGAFFVSPGALVAEDGSVRYTLINTEVKPWTATTQTVAP